MGPHGPRAPGHPARGGDRHAHAGDIVSKFTITGPVPRRRRRPEGAGKCENRHIGRVRGPAVAGRGTGRDRRAAAAAGPYGTPGPVTESYGIGFGFSSNIWAYWVILRVRNSLRGPFGVCRKARRRPPPGPPAGARRAVAAPRRGGLPGRPDPPRRVRGRPRRAPGAGRRGSPAEPGGGGLLVDRTYISVHGLT